MSKILYAASSESHITNFHLPYIEKLRAEGNTVKVMAKGEGVDFNIPFEKKFFSPRNLLAVRKIKRILKSECFDAVILNTTLAAFYIRLAMRKKKRPRVVNIVHGYLFSQHVSRIKRKVLLFCEKLMAKKTDSIVVMNSNDYAIATENALCLGEVKMTRGMGAVVREESVSAGWVRQYTATDGKFLLCFVGELSRRKNQRFLICALPEIKMSIPDTELMLVGAGSSESELRALADKLGISDSVHFLGQRPNPCDFIRASDLYVSASEIEGMPFNVIEALGCGKTVLCSDIKGHCDLIENGKTGYLYAFGDIADFVSRVTNIYNGALSVDGVAIEEKYKEYSFDLVFSETYSALRGLIFDE